MANPVIDDLVSEYLNEGSPLEESEVKESEIKLFNKDLEVKTDGINLKNVVPNLKSDLYLTKLDRSEIPEGIQDLIPTLNKQYIPDIEALTAVVNAVEGAEPMLITGPTGCGKSEMLAYVCALAERPFIRVNMSEDIDSSMVFGQIGAANGATYWDNGPAAEAGIYGALLNIDEYDAAPAGIAMGFQWMLEHQGKMYLKEKPGTSLDKTINLHKNFRVAFSGNTLGQGDDTGHFAGTQVQNTAMLDRIRCSIQMDYMSPAAELQMLEAAFPQVSSDIQTMMIQVANNIRGAYKKMEVGLTMSPRTLLNWNAKLMTYKDPEIALTYAFLNKLRSSDRKVVAKLFARTFSGSTKWVS
jgi:cobaltochelatase CobS